MTETTQDLLSKAENALWAGDRRTAGIFLHKVLLQDFNDPYAWRLLHAMLGSGQPFEPFQISFALKYYPKKAHLLHIPSETAPGAAAEAQGVGTAPAEVSPEADGAAAARAIETPAALPVQPSRPAVEAVQPVPPTQAKTDTAAEVELGHTAPLAVERLPYVLLPDSTCPICGKACPPRAKFCIYCGMPIEAVPAPTSGTGSLLLYRPKTTLAQERVFSIWVDGKQVDQIVDAEQRLLSLPSGPHTLVIKSAGRSSQPLQFTIRPSARVRLVVQPARSSVRGAPPDLWVFPFHEEGIYRRELTRKEQAWLVVRTLLIILLVSGFIGMIIYIAFYMAWN